MAQTFPGMGGLPRASMGVKSENKPSGWDGSLHLLTDYSSHICCQTRHTNYPDHFRLRRRAVGKLGML